MKIQPIRKKNDYRGKFLFGEMMAISHKLKLIFIHIPKNAGTSIKKSLSMSLWGHETAQQIKKKYPKEWNEYKKFTIVRNPWDRVVSCYLFAKKEESFWHSEKEKYIEGRKTSAHPDFKLLNNKNFKETIDILKTNINSLSQHWSHQFKYIINEKEEIDDCIKIIKFESLEKEMNIFLDSAGLPKIEIGKINSSGNENYKKFYNENLIEIVNEIYNKDIKMFGYKF